MKSLIFEDSSDSDEEELNSTDKKGMEMDAKKKWIPSLIGPE